MKENRTGEILGVLGGMGALASAEFLKTIYEQNVGRDEQDAPVVLVYSDPTFPDRTEAFLRGEAHLVRTPLVAALDRLSQLGASRFVLCCVTIHYLVPSLPDELRGRVISLLDTIFDSLQKAPRQQKHLMICSTGTRRLALLEEHKRAAEAGGRLIFPDEQEQQTLHAMIYEMKNGHRLPEMKAYIESLLDRYEVSSFIAGCSEIHLLSKQYPSTGEGGSPYTCIDPLLIIAKELRRKTT